MTVKLIRRYRCDNCGRVEERDYEWFPAGWINIPVLDFGLLCDECKGVALAALETRARAEVQ